MRSINLNTISNDLRSKDAQLVATAGFKWFVKGHLNYIGDDRDQRTLKMIMSDYLDLIKVAQMIENLDTYGRGMSPGDIKRAKRKILHTMENMDTNVRDEIPVKVFNRFEIYN